MAVEPTTGNTLLHTAILAQRIDVLDILRYLRSHNVGAFHRLFYALFSHQNHHGDTILHSAVRSGKLELVKAAMQVFNHEYLDEADERLQLAEGGLGNQPYYDDGDEDATSMRIGELTFLLQQNNKGRTATDEARAAGYTDIVAWLDRNINLCDPRGERFNESTVQIWRESCDDYYGRP
jgi:ankyrin repeat protein